MTRLMAVVLAAGGPAAEAAAANFGSLSLKPGESQRIGTTSGQSLHVCNDLESASTVSVVVGSHDPRTLQPGLCLDDVGNVFVATNQGSGPANVTYRVQSRSRAGRS